MQIKAAILNRPIHVSVNCKYDIAVKDMPITTLQAELEQAAREKGSKDHKAEPQD